MGPDGIPCAAGFRGVRLADPPELPLYSAAGAPLGLTWGDWLAAHGKVVLIPLPDGRERVAVAILGLKPLGHFSLFMARLGQEPDLLTPLDGDGADNDFDADPEGRAVKSTVAPARLTHDDAILIMYHSDGKSHGISPGQEGVNAHRQLFARP